VDVSSDGKGGCTFKWAEQSYVVAAATRPFLLWRLRDPTFVWDGSLGVTLPENDPNQDLDSAGRRLDESIFQWLAIKTPTSVHVDKPLTVELVITQVKPYAKCTPAKDEPSYTIVLKK